MSELDSLDVAIARRCRAREIASAEANHAHAMRMFNSPSNLQALAEGKAAAFAPPTMPEHIQRLKGLSDAELVEAYRHVIDSVGESKLHDGFIDHGARGV
jgi:hypothetical protein